MKSGKFDTPFDYDTFLDIDNYHIEYVNPMEIVQGGPVVGKLSINNYMINNYSFGGPFLYSNQSIYIPALVRSAFILSRIDLRDNSIHLIGKSKRLICLEKIEEKKIYYFDTYERTVLKVYDLSE